MRVRKENAAMSNEPKYRDVGHWDVKKLVNEFQLDGRVTILVQEDQIRNLDFLVTNKKNMAKSAFSETMAEVFISVFYLIFNCWRFYIIRAQQSELLKIGEFCDRTRAYQFKKRKINESTYEVTFYSN